MPLKLVPHPCQARLRHACDFLVKNHVIPDIDTCHFTNETLKGLKGSPTESCSCPSTRVPPPRITWPVKPQSGKNMELCTITLSIMIQVSFYLTEQRIKTHKHQGTFWTNFPFEFTKWIWEINDSSKLVIVVCQAFCFFLWLSGQSLGRTMHGKVKIWAYFPSS